MGGILPELCFHNAAVSQSDDLQDAATHSTMSSATIVCSGAGIGISCLSS